MLPVGGSNGQTDLSVPGSTLGVAERRLSAVPAVLAPVRREPGLALGWDDAGVLKELRGSHGGPHAGTRLVALALALLLAAPLTVFLWRLGSALVHQVL